MFLKFYTCCNFFLILGAIYFMAISLKSSAEMISDLWVLQIEHAKVKLFNKYPLELSILSICNLF